MKLTQSLRKLCTLVVATTLVAVTLAAGGVTESAEAATPATTAWQNGQFSMNRAGVVSRSNIILGKPNTAPAQSLGLGNGSLGVAAWAANGFTAQLNRTDTMPDRKSPGQVNIPGLSTMTSAANFTGTLDLYNGVLNQSGGGMTLKAWVASGKDELIIDVTGANPSVTQTATISLQSGRNPAAAVSGAVGTLAETWIDDHEPQWTGATFGSLAAITAAGQNVTASVVDSRTVRVSFLPRADGSFRVIVGGPVWKGGNAATTATALFGSDATASQSSLLSTHTAWWNSFWANTGLMKMESADGVAEYMENLRTIYLYTEAASMRGTYPGSQAGSTNMFNFSRDAHNWTPSMTWLWNLRTQITSNMSSGNFALNKPIFDLYLNALPGIKTWTNAQMGGLPGACVSETMRFNGNGGNPAAGANASCSRPSSPNWNALNITSGAEISFFIWQQYQYTGDVAFLTRYYPLIKESAIFLLAYHTVGSDGLLHSNANAHETQWAVNDPTTNIVAMQALFPLAVAAAQKLGVDGSYVTQWQAAIPKIPPYARTDQATRTQLLTPASDAAGNNVIGVSYQPTATIRNSENVGLEPVWPWGLIGDQSSASLMQLATRTYNFRPVKDGLDWSLDAIQAARLNLASEVRAKLISITQGHQVYINGMADLGATVGQQSYLEQSASVATAINEALVQNYDGLLRIAPAWPSGWDVSGTVWVQGNSKVNVQVQAGQLTTIAIEAGTTQTQRVKNPWPGQAIRVVNGNGGAVVVASTTAAIINVPLTAGQKYLVERVSNPTSSYPFTQVTGSAATSAKHLGGVQIGLDGVVAPGSAPTFFANANYSGTGVTLAAGSYDINRLATLGIANDSVSSIQVPAGFTVVAYGDGNFTGPSWTFTSNNPNLANSGNDNSISSLVITGSGGGGGGSTPTFYQDTAFGGTAVTLAVGSYSTAQMTAAGLSNNWASSVRVPAGYSVRAYDGDLTGTNWTWTSDQSSLPVNDAISSVVITTTGGANPSFYQDTAYGGTAVSLPVGSYSTAQMTAAGLPNNWASSIRVPSGFTVRVYDGDLTGTSWTYTSDQSNLVTNGNNDVISSVVITRP